MNQYKGIFVALFLFCFVQLHSEGKSIIAVAKPVSEYVATQDTSNSYSSISIVGEKSPNPDKKRTQSNERKKRIVSKIANTTEDVIFIILEIAVLILEDYDYGCQKH